MVKKFVFVYLYDILIFSPSVQVHTQHIRQVLQWLWENQLYIISAEGISAEWPTPDSRSGLWD